MKNTKYKIIVDTREQKPYWKEGSDVIRKKLDTGDYSIEGYENKIAIERKSLSDLYGSLTSGHKRFARELERSKKLDYFTILIDGSLTSCANKEFKGSEHTKTKASTIIKILFTLHTKHGINFVFCNGRYESRRYIKALFESYLKNRT